MTPYLFVELDASGLGRTLSAERQYLNIDSSDPHTLRITLPTDPFGFNAVAKLKAANAFVKVRITRSDGACLETEGHIGSPVGDHFTISASPATFS